MYCPRCSKEFTPGPSYCRTCGLSLDGVVEIVTGEAENEPEIKKGPNQKLIRAGMGSIIPGMVIGLSIPIFKNLELFTAAATARYIFLGLIMLGILLLGAGVLFPSRRYVKKKAPRSSREPETPMIETARLEALRAGDLSVNDFQIPSNSREPDSVTENTTRLLH